MPSKHKILGRWKRPFTASAIEPAIRSWPPIREKNPMIRRSMYFDTPVITHVVGNLYQGGVERGVVLPKFFKHVISLYPNERFTVAKGQLDTNVSATMYDDEGRIPVGMVASLAQLVNACAEDGPTLVHCQAGMNRSGLILATALMLKGMSANDAIALLRRKRSPYVLSNVVFAKWLRDSDPGAKKEATESNTEQVMVVESVPTAEPFAVSPLT